MVRADSGYGTQGNSSNGLALAQSGHYGLAPENPWSWDKRKDIALRLRDSDMAF